MRKPIPNELRTLEELIDAIGLQSTLAAVAKICADKADHLRENWQDERASSQWGQAAARIETTAGLASVASVSF